MQLKDKLVNQVSKENIPIKKAVFNKYQSVEEIFRKEQFIKCKTNIIKRVNVNLDNKSATEIYHIAIKVFDNNYKDNIFLNRNNKIKITHSDIKESINKIYNDRLQNIFLKEHIYVFANIKYLIESSLLVNQTKENKNRKKYLRWSYYYNKVIINDIKYDIVFDVVSRLDGENHYRLQRLKKASAQSALPLNNK